MILRSCALAVVLVAVGGGLPAAVASGSAVTARPGIAAVSPLAGRPAGGDLLMIRGTSLGRVSAVSFGGVRSRRLTHISASEISVVVPAHPIGRVRVRLVVDGVAGSDFAHYRFAPPPRQLSWSRDRTIDPDLGNLAGLSCPTRGFCASVDGSETAPALLTFAPHGRAHRSPLPPKVGLPAVSCVSASLCFALLNGTVSRWNGERWSAFRPVAPKRAFLGSLSCATGGARFCVSVGGQGATWVHRSTGWSRAARVPHMGYDQSLSCATAHFCMLVTGGRAFRFDGAAWHAASRGLPSSLQFSSPVLSCAGPRFCLLVDEVETARWTGLRWETSFGGSAGYGDALGCASATLCILGRGDGSVGVWRDGRWREFDSVGPAVFLPGVSCPEIHECLVTIWSGVAIHRPAGWSRHYVERAGGDLSDVSCVSAAWCMAVDGHGNAVTRAGGTWRRPRAVDRRRALSAVSCASDNFCVAVDGADPYDHVTQSGIGHAVVYSKGRWHAPAVIDSGHGLTDVACASDRMCVAVDDAGNAVRWNGHRWLAPRQVGRLLEAVACPSAVRCVAVGKRSAQWDHGHWRSMRNPVGSTQLTDVTCTGPRYCVAGGDGGFYVRHAGVWSSQIHHARLLWQVQVACISRSACFGSQDNQVDVWDYAFDGSRVSYAGDTIYDAKMSCTQRGCIAVSLFYSTLGLLRGR